MKYGTVGLFTCPDCGKTIEIANAFKRKHCPECSKKAKLRSWRENAPGARARQKERQRLAEAMAPYRKPDDAKQKREAELDAFNAKQIKLQCRRCAYRLYSAGSKQTIGCAFMLLTGERHKKGAVPGECGSFCDFNDMSQGELMALRRKAISLGEADNA